MVEKVAAVSASGNVDHDDDNDVVDDVVDDDDVAARPERHLLPGARGGLALVGEGALRSHAAAQEVLPKVRRAFCRRRCV